MQFQKGQLVNNRYAIDRNIHDGLMSEVYVVSDGNLFDEKYVLKVLPINKLVSPNDLQEAVGRFKQEVKLLVGLNHPKIVKVRDYFTTKDSGGADVYCMILDYVAGEDLNTLLERNVHFSEDTVREYGGEILNAVDYLHTYKPPIMFRDVKPSNVIRKTLDDHLMLIDFGIAKTFQGNSQGTAIGTPGFAAPEQFSGNATPLSDIYGIGTTMYALLTADMPPYVNLLTGQASLPDLLRNKRSGVSPSLVDIIDKATQLNPADRYQSAKDMMQALNGKTRIVVPSGTAVPARSVTYAQPKTSLTQNTSVITSYDPNFPHQLHIVDGNIYPICLDDLVRQCLADPNSLQPKFGLASGKEVYRPFTFRENLLARIHQFSQQNQQGLFNVYLDSCTGIVYRRNSTKFKIIPICKKLIELKSNFRGDFVRLSDGEYNVLEYPELDSTRGKYNQRLSKSEMLKHPAWNASVETVQYGGGYLKEYADIVFDSFGKSEASAFYVRKNTLDNELRALCVGRIGFDSLANGGSDLGDNARFLRVSP